MNTTVDKNIKYSVVKRKNGYYQPQKEYGHKMLYPAFDSLRDAHIFMRYTRKDYITGIVGNVQIIEQV
jgi:hypothetical protein